MRSTRSVFCFCPLSLVLLSAIAGAAVAQLLDLQTVRVMRWTETHQWAEWTPTWGARIACSFVELRYSGSASSVSHRLAVSVPIR